MNSRTVLLRLVVVVVILAIAKITLSRNGSKPRPSNPSPITMLPDGHIVAGSIPHQAFPSAKENAIFIPLVDPSIRPGSGITVRLGNKEPRFTVERVVIQEGPWVNLTGEEDNFAASRQPMVKVYVKEDMAEYR